jgi:hypothetical protein
MKKIIFLMISMTLIVSAIGKEELRTALQKQTSPFSYDLGIKLIPSKQRDADTTVCCHGYGSSNEIVKAVSSFNTIPDHVVGFNFPDYKCIAKNYDPRMSAFGTINEILPLLYVIRCCVIDAGLTKLNLYGFSAGGGAIINALAVLNRSTYDSQLTMIGIQEEEKRKIISALEGGIIVLDCPLKSIDEIMSLRGKTAEFTILAERYIKNNMRPVDELHFLKGLKLTILVHFQSPDEILSNRDDNLFIDRLRHANRGITEVVIGNDGGHNAYHPSLWYNYRSLRKILK